MFPYFFTDVTKKTWPALEGIADAYVILRVPAWPKVESMFIIQEKPEVVPIWPDIRQESCVASEREVTPM